MARQRSRNGDNVQRYEDIVIAAADLFADKGFNGTSLNDIADAIGLLKGSLYHYISSKEDLLFDVVKITHEGLQENVRFADGFTQDPLRQLAAFSFGHVAFNSIPDRLHRGTVFMQESKHLAPKKRALVTKVRDDYEQYLRAIIARGRKEGQFDPELDPRMCSFMTLGVLTSYIRWFKPGGPITSEALGRESAAFVLASVESPGTRSKLGSRFAVIDQVISEFKQKKNPTPANAAAVEHKRTAQKV